MLPKAIAAEVETRGVSLTDPPHHLPVLGGECEGAKYHSPRPMVVYRVNCPNGEQVHLCGVCRDTVGILESLQLRAEYGTPIPWPVLREFGNRVRNLGVFR